jgi:hypothetical protein
MTEVEKVTFCVHTAIICILCALVLELLRRVKDLERRP